MSLAALGFSTHAVAQVPAPSAGISKLQVAYHDVGMEVVVWYPTQAPSRRINAVSVAFDAAPNGPIIENKHPLVLLSHGTGGMNLGHYPLATALARAGFMVASMTHPGDNFRDRSLIADERYFHERPRQISIVLDALLKDPKWAALIDQQSIGAVGHSAGGYAVAALVGAVPDRERLSAHCQSVDDDPACEYADPAKGLLNQADQIFELPMSVQKHARLKDERIKSAVLLAPLGAVIKAGSLVETTVPVKLIGAANDQVLARQYHYDWIATQLEQSPAQASHEVSTAPGTGHFSFLAPFQASFIEATRAQLGDIVEPPAGFDRAAFQAELSETVVRWMQKTLGKKTSG
ncbi:MAG: alpha/beta hydrolase family protein [Burkholderiaceae bacterium]